MKVLILTKIFPNRVEPGSAPFNRQQFARLREHCEVEVLATIPWFPGARALKHWSPAGRLTSVPAHEVIDSLEVHHPRTLFIPRVAPGWSSGLYAASLLPHALRYRGKVDVVLGSWAYPDGVAAVRLAELMGVPAVVKLHGSDINVVAKMPGPNAQLRKWLPRAARILSVSRQLGDAVRELGVDGSRIDFVPNGVDTGLFHPRPRSAARAELGIPDALRVIVYVGRLEREKGVFDLLDAVDQLKAEDNVQLVLIGNGNARQVCEARAAQSGGRIRVLGARPLTEIPIWLAASNLLTLPSWNEGMPNVVLEALASGRRVVATDVGAIPDLVDSELLGELVPKQSPDALARALARAVATDYAPELVARSAQVQSWEASARGLHATLERAVGRELAERPSPATDISRAAA